MAQGAAHVYTGHRVSSRGFDAEPDIKVEALIMSEWILVMLVEIKPELGLGEPSVEVMRWSDQTSGSEGPPSSTSLRTSLSLPICIFTSSYKTANTWSGSPRLLRLSGRLFLLWWPSTAGKRSSSDPSISWPELIRDEHAQGASVTQYWHPGFQAQPAKGEDAALLVATSCFQAHRQVCPEIWCRGAHAVGGAWLRTSIQLQATGDGSDWLVVDTVAKIL
ncbi:hypothetical protein SELMODRAFT_418206 [Selaginella moellendorffii]|uniref:Uncharacterized protein n=1 Tax=Selaginella moellendorffii TaxID=88036 RepID=D8S505_SELML|nr:hypothetical protein SELMODRAFT_418206 [Selaginella moellendorffii]